MLVRNMSHAFALWYLLAFWPLYKGEHGRLERSSCKHDSSSSYLEPKTESNVLSMELPYFGCSRPFFFSILLHFDARQSPFFASPLNIYFGIYFKGL